ncbi:hypothetical protein ACFWNT_24585 [Streptomyces sp. NPDC058409]|uniref:hypothetical protein n=1 Tax=Streptomyces sp. NPDC058409 TaxID=3346484 RepID=UPI00364F98B4
MPTPPPGGPPAPGTPTPSPPPAPSPPGLLRRSIRRFREAHRQENLENLRGWGELLGYYIAPIVLVGGAAWTVWTWYEDRAIAEDSVAAAEKGPNLESDLKIAKVEALLGKGLKGEVKEYTGEKNPATVEKINAWGPHVKVTVQNIATAPALITKVKVTFRQSFDLEPCYGVGGQFGDTVKYQLTIPPDQPMVKGTRSHKVPFTKEAEAAFTVGANAFEQFTLTTGNEVTMDGESPWIGVFDGVLESTQGKKVAFGPVAVIDTGGNPVFYADGDTWHIEPESVPGCTERNAATVAKILRTPKVTASKELKSLDKAFRGLKKKPVETPSRSEIPCDDPRASCGVW